MNEKKTADEKDVAIWMANKALDRPHSDPDDDLSTISRQLLRALEQNERLKEAARELISIAESYEMCFGKKMTRQKRRVQTAIENAKKLTGK